MATGWRFWGCHAIRAGELRPASISWDPATLATTPNTGRSKNASGRWCEMSAPDQNDELVLTRAQANELIAFLLSSAEITLKEPIHYGPLRLVDAVSRLIGFMEANGAVHDGEFLADLKDE